MFLIWEPLLVEPFRQHPRVTIPDLTKDFVTDDTEAWRHFNAVERENITRPAKLARHVSALALGFQESYVGMYSNMHEVCAYRFDLSHSHLHHVILKLNRNGYGHEETIRLGEM